VDVEAAARRWQQTWQRGWRDRDVEAIASLYADDAVYRALAFREPDRGIAGVCRYLEENFGVEEQIECWFGEPIAAGNRAAVEWWGTWIENGQRLTLAGTTVLRFDSNGQVVDHRDYWNQVERREPPFEGWAEL
jgi:SnoaL-like domain